jgi:hypothetical protein
VALNVMAWPWTDAGCVEAIVKALIGTAAAGGAAMSTPVAVATATSSASTVRRLSRITACLDGGRGGSRAPDGRLTERCRRSPSVSPLNAARRAVDERSVTPRRARPKLTPPTLTDVVGGLVLLAIAALLVAVAVVTAAG